MSEAKWSITEAKCLQMAHNIYASHRDAISPPKGNLMLSHSAGMHHTDIPIAGIRKDSISLRSITSFLHTCPRLFHLRFRCSLKNVVIL
ncbi:MAG: hypothetical protein Q4G12_09760, partial [Bacteroidales bacterium]|nr:hypothetical protein [Bacteroidales bacterium]